MLRMQNPKGPLAFHSGGATGRHFRMFPTGQPAQFAYWQSRNPPDRSSTSR